MTARVPAALPDREGRRFLQRAALCAAFLLLCAGTAAKGILPLFHTDELYFWLTTYRHGPVRRGLVGTLVNPFLAGDPNISLHAVAAACCLLALLALVGLAAGEIWRRSGQGSLVVVGLSGLLLATSPFLGLIAHHVGYPDALIAALVLACGLHLPRASPAAMAAELIVCGMVHELAALLLLPIVAFEMAMRPALRPRACIIVVAGVAIALAGPLLAGGSQPDLQARLVAAGLSAADAQQQIAISLHQGLSQAMARMRGVWVAHTLNGVLGIAYAGLPGFCMLWLGLPSARRWIAASASTRRGRSLRLALYAAACMGPIALLAIAWDLARLASFTTLAAFITVSLTLERTSAAPGRSAMGLSAVSAGCFVLLPVMNLYFDYGRCIRLQMTREFCPACARAGVAMIDFYNRDLPATRRSVIDGDAAYGNQRK